MSTDETFADLIARVRNGDAAAATEIYERYGPTILRTARIRMTNSRLRTIFQSAEIQNSVFRTFLRRIQDEGNAWKIDARDDLMKLLVSITHNNLIDKIRIETTIKRGGDKKKKSLETGDDVEDHGPTAEEIAIRKEEAALCWDLMDEDTRALYKLRYEEELSWKAIGALLGPTAEATRKKLERDLDEVRQEREQEDQG